jgi:hypothetical protein
LLLARPQANSRIFVVLEQWSFQNLHTPQINSVLLNQAIQWSLIVLSIDLNQYSSVYHLLSDY